MPGLRTQNYLNQRLFVSAPYCDLSQLDIARHQYPRGHGRRNGLPAWEEGYVWRGQDRWQECIWLDTIYEQGGVVMPAGHPPHICLFCSERIAPGEAEVKLVLGPLSTRYTHSSWERCQQALRNHSRSSFPGKRPRINITSGLRDTRGGILERDRLPQGDPDMASDTRQILREFRSKGYVTELGGKNGHWFVRKPDGELLTVMPSTPSDIRGLNAARLILKRAPNLKAASREQRMARAAAELGASVPTAAPQALTPAAKMAQEGHLSIPSVKTGDVITTAWWLWDNLRKLAEHDGERAEHHGAAGWHWNGTLQGVVSSLWPLIPERRDDKHRREIITSLASYLKATQHLAVLATHGQHDSDYWVSDVWRGGPSSVGQAVTQARKAGVAFGGPLALNQKQVMDAIRRRAQNKAITFTIKEIVDRTGLSRVTVTGTLHTIRNREDLGVKHVARGAWAYTPPIGEPGPIETEKETLMPAAPTAARNPHRRLAVLRAAQEHPDVLFSIQEASGWLEGAPGSSVSTALRYWAEKGFLEKVGSGLYICRSSNAAAGEEPETVALPASTEQFLDDPSAGTRPLRDEAPAPVTPPAPPTAAPVSTPSASVPQRIADLLRLKPDAKLYAEVGRFGNGTVIVVMDEDGGMHELRSGD